MDAAVFSKPCECRFTGNAPDVDLAANSLPTLPVELIFSILLSSTSPLPFSETPYDTEQLCVLSLIPGFRDQAQTMLFHTVILEEEIRARQFIEHSRRWTDGVERVKKLIIIGNAEDEEERYQVELDTALEVLEMGVIAGVESLDVAQIAGFEPAEHRLRSPSLVGELHPTRRGDLGLTAHCRPEALGVFPESSQSKIISISTRTTRTVPTRDAHDRSTHRALPPRRILCTLINGRLLRPTTIFRGGDDSLHSPPSDRSRQYQSAELLLASTPLLSHLGQISHVQHDSGQYRARRSNSHHLSYPFPRDSHPLCRRSKSGPGASRRTSGRIGSRWESQGGAAEECERGGFVGSRELERDGAGVGMVWLQSLVQFGLRFVIRIRCHCTSIANYLTPNANV